MDLARGSSEGWFWVVWVVWVVVVEGRRRGGKLLLVNLEK